MSEPLMARRLMVGASHLFLLALLALPLPVPAAAVEFDMGGVINDVTSFVNIPVPGVSVGDAWRVRARYEGDIPAAPTGAISRFVLQYYEVSISPSVALTILPHEDGWKRQVIDLAVGRNSASGNFLQFRASNVYFIGDVAQGALAIWPDYLIDGRKLWHSFVVLQDPTGNSWLYNDFGTNLDVGPGDFPAARFVFKLYDDRRSPTEFDTLFGSVDYYRATIVPAPGTVLLLGTGLAAVAGIGRSRRRTVPGPDSCRDGS